jgi:5-methylcytosine-specific restriction endonuclease McrA
VNKKFSDEDVAYIYNALRKATIQWSGRAECFRLARKKVFVRRSKSSGKPIYKLQWQCAECREWFRDPGSMEVDHKKEIGGIGSFNGDWTEMISKVFPRPVEEHLQLLCVYCHLKKTKAFAAANSKWQRKPR